MLQWNTGFFPELEQGEAQVEVQMKFLMPHLVEDRPPIITVAYLQKPPNKFGPLPLLANRVPHGYPASAFNAVHDKGIPILAEKECLVTQKR